MVTNVRTQSPTTRRRKAILSIRRARVGSERVVIYPFSGPPEGLDVTEALVDALAMRIAETTSGNTVLNRLEAEIQLWQILGEGTS